MRALRSFTVRATLPEPLAPLRELAMNLRWSWDERTQDLFRWVDFDLWEASRHDPVRLLGRVERARLEQLAADPAFLAFLSDVHEDLRRHLTAPLWFQNRPPSPLRSVAYFSPEFGIAEALPQYSGGLGVLAGDHLKAASASGLPLVGVGLFYRQGYFSQALDAAGWQQERYPTLDPYAMSISLAADARVTVDLAGVKLAAQVWRADVGRVRLYLLDADVEENDPEYRLVTDRLYGGGGEHRLRQEILLGVGGVRALEAVGEPTQVFHTNEGHAGFLGLERIRTLVSGGLTFPEALEASRAGAVFTTHTPVPAGIDRFPRDLMERYFAGWAEEVGVPFGALMALGHAPGEPVDAPFNMAYMGFRLAAAANGVSKLHGAVSRQMFAPLWPSVPAEEVPIGSVTNGVHADTWVSPEMDDLLSRHVLPSWSDAEPEDWARVTDVRDDELWRAREQGRERLVSFVRERMRSSLLAQGLTEPEVAWTDDMLDPRALTLGFARRFATYKRATMLLSQPERLRALLCDPERPVQLVFAGKAHPADDAGKEMIRRIVEFSRQPDVRSRFAFVENYDIGVARVMYQGADVWLNNPRRPLEACGTSGEKAALNGSLNCSVLDGWWDEMYDGDNGWAVASAEGLEEGRRDEVEASSLFDILERQVVPLFYGRSRESALVPRRWVNKVRASLRTLGPQVVASRMVREYAAHYYEPAAVRADALAASGHARARELAAWKARVAQAWDGVRVTEVDAEAAVAELGAEREVEARVTLGALGDADVAVQLVHGPVSATEEITEATVVAMEAAGAPDDAGGQRYRAAYRCTRPGRYGFAVRVVPAHADLASPVELSRIAWA